MTELTPISLRRAVVNTSSEPGVPHIHGLHHWAYRCRDSEETRAFYEGLLGLPLAAAVYHDRVPSTGEHCPYYHVFFELADGSYLAFFDLLDDQPYQQDRNTPMFVHHLALEVDSRQSLDDAKRRLEAAGVEVLGPVPHGWFDSIYFFDPNGMRLELVHRTATLERMRSMAEAARALLAERPAKIAELRRSAPRDDARAPDASSAGAKP